MRRLLLALAALALTGTASAACNKSGRYLNGLPLPLGLTAECGLLYDLYKGGVMGNSNSSGMTLEVYRVRSGFGTLLPHVLADAAKQGFTFKDKQYIADPFNVTLAFSKPGHPLVVNVMELDDAVIMALVFK